MISLSYFDPLWINSRKSYLGELTDRLNSYSHTIQALGGYDTASLSIGITLAELDDWLENGLGRHVEVFGNGLAIWEGFVNGISVSVGQLSINRGPFLNICNRVHGRYSDYSTGVDGVTATSEDTTSQAIYGIRPRILNVGQVSLVSATKIVTTFLEENKYPETSTSFGNKSDLTLSLELQGYYKLLDIPYINASDTTYTLREKIIDAITYEPNNIFNVDTSEIAANDLSVFERENDKKCWDVIKELVGMGGASDNSRMLFGIYENRKPIYQTMPTAIEYTQQLFSNGDIMALSGVVPPYQVLPGKWLEFSDFGAGLITNVIRNNPRYMFIESVTYTAPYDISLTGGKIETLPQQLAKLGLGGI